MDETECTAANFMPKDLIEIICILERDEKCPSYKIIRKRKYFGDPKMRKGLLLA